MKEHVKQIKSAEETVTISRAEYENMQAQIQWLMEQLRLSRQKRFGASSEHTSEDAMEQLSLLFNEAEVYADHAAQEDDSSVVVAAHKRHKAGCSELQQCKYWRISCGENTGGISMHLIIISGATRPRKRSNTAKIISAFLTGFQKCGHTAEVWYLSDRTSWAGARAAFCENTNILFALPLYVENVPGTMLEFLESLPPKTTPGTRVSFLVQGGFPEASQGRCCECFLKTLPEQLGCVYGGTLIRGDMFAIGLLGKKHGNKMVRPFIQIGDFFGKYGYFHESIITEYTSPEYLSEKQIRQFHRLSKLSRWLMGIIAKRLGCTEKLDAMPYCEPDA